MSKYTSFVFILLLCRNLAFAQCQGVDFEIPSSACIQSTLAFRPSDLDQVAYEWDFCAGDLDNPPTTSVLTTATPSAYKVAFIQANGSTFGFYTSRSNGHLYRLNFGSDPTASPTPEDLGNLGLPGGAKLSVAIVKTGANYFGFLIDFNNLIYRFAFGKALTNQPANAQLIYQNGLLANPIDMVTAADESGKFVFVANLSSNKITRLKFSEYDADVSSMLVDEFTVTNSGSLAGISVIKDCEDWYALTTARGTGQISKIFFDETLADDDPIATQLNGLSFTVTQPAGISIAFDNNHYFGFLVSNEGQSKLYRIDFGDTMANAPAADDALGDLNLLSGAWGFSMFKHQSHWITLASENTGPRIFSIEFPNNCFSQQAYSAQKINNLVADADGQFDVTLTTTSSQGVSTTKAHQLIIQNKTIPAFDILSNGICLTAPVEFSIDAQDISFIQNAEWDFGDQTTSENGTTPSHTYLSTGQYVVNLQLTATNGCESAAEKPLRIYPKPVADFNVPSSILCTNTDITFSNLTNDVFNGNLKYQWTVDNVGAGTSRDLVTSLSTTGVKTIGLTTSIDGCSSQVTKMSSEVFAGPQIEFDVIGHCENETIQFAENIDDDVLSVEWNFDDGNSSAEPDVNHTFTLQGSYQVSLAALSPNGCNNSKIKTVIIHDKPSPDFSIEGPPSACSGYASQFADLTPPIVDGQIESWHWDFNDGINADERNPAHIFQAAGEHNVQLTVTSDDGCSNTIVKPVMILQSPSVSFENGPACLSKPTIFTGTSNDALQYYWEIGTAYYEAQNTAHVFSTPGSHTVKLNVLGSNDCISVLSRQINVPLPLDPIFSVTNNCKDFESRFSASFSSVDPVVTRNWNFGGEGSSTEANPSHTFTSTGNKLVTLQVTTASGCIYQRQHTVNVLGAPVASFTFTPDFGVPPQEISFVNSSSNASSFKWDFGDGNSSTANSPKHTFTALGDYEVKLTATNEAACQVTSSQVVSMVAPLPDVDLSLMTITPNGDGTSRIIVTIANNGNTFLKNLPIRLDVSGNVTLETNVNETIAPFSMYNLVLDFGIAQTQALEFLCASTTLEGDLHPEGNRICNQLKSETAILSPYPNPAVDVLTVEWVAQEGEEVDVKLVDTDGKSVVNFTEVSTTGLNQRLLDISHLRSGIYILRIVSPTRAKTHRILVPN